MKLINKDNMLLTSAKDVYDELGIKYKFATWIKLNLGKAYLEEDKDFVRQIEQSTGGRPLENYLLTRDSVLSIIIMSGGQNARSLRKKVIELYNQHDTGKAFTSEQFIALMDLSRAMTLVSIQKDVEKRHFALYNDRYTWYKYRAALLGYSTKDLIEAMRKVNKKHHSTRASLIQLDSSELIRTGIIDLMMALGKTEQYAINVGNLCKEFAQKAKLGNIIWDDTQENPLNINYNEVNERKALLIKSTRQIK